MAGTDGAARSELLLKLARQVTGRHDLEDVLGEVFRCLRPMLAFGGGSIQLLDDDGWIQMAAVQNARAYAREGMARAYAEAIGQRLAAARSLVDAARGAVLRGDRAELERQLARIDGMLAGDISPKKMLRLPQQRDTEIPSASTEHISRP